MRKLPGELRRRRGHSIRRQMPWNVGIRRAGKRVADDSSSQRLTHAGSPSYEKTNRPFTFGDHPCPQIHVARRGNVLLRRVAYPRSAVYDITILAETEKRKRGTVNSCLSKSLAQVATRVSTSAKNLPGRKGLAPSARSKSASRKRARKSSYMHRRTSVLRTRPVKRS